MEVIISVTSEIKCASVVEMSEGEFARLDAALDGDDYAARLAAQKELYEMVDPYDVQEVRLLSVDGFSRRPSDDAVL